MTYLNITSSTVRKAETYIDENLVYTLETNCAKKHILARAGHFVLAPASVVTSTLDTIIGIGAGLATIATGGKHFRTMQFAMFHLNSSKSILARPYSNLLKTLNPEAKFSNKDTNGLLSHYVIGNLKKYGKECLNSEYFLMRHMVSRLTYALLGISCIVTRVVDAIIGILAAIASFITLGKVESINTVACRGLQALGLIHDLFYCTINVMNPWAGTGKKN